MLIVRKQGRVEKKKKKKNGGTESQSYLRSSATSPVGNSLHLGCSLNALRKSLQKI